MLSAPRGARECALAILLATALGAPAMAAAPTPAQVQAVTGTASPGRASEQVQPPALPEKTVAPQVKVREMALQAAPKGAEKVVFVLKSLTVTGVTAYSKAKIESLYASEIGQKISLVDLYGIANAITRQYRNDGYILTQVVVPPQTISGGNAKLQVVEGYVDRVNVRDDQARSPHARAQIESYARRISGKRPLNIRDMERALLLINDVPGVKARSVLSPSKTTPGAADLEVIVDRKPYDAELDANNFGTKYLGPYQMGTSGAVNDVLGNNERISAQVVYAPGAHLDHELMYFDAGYLQPVGPYGTTIGLDTNYTNTVPGFNLKQFDVRGEAEYAGLTVTQPIIRSRRINLSGHVTFDVRDVDTKDNIEPTRNDRIRALRAGGRFEYLSTMFGAAWNMASAEVSQGLDVLGSTSGSDLNTSRPGADETFTKFDAELQRLQRLTSKVNVLGAVHGQISDNPLWTSEQFGIGGMDYGRGYDPSEVVGDQGVAGKVELQWQKPTEIRFLNDWQLYSFYDVGTVWNHDATTSALKRDSLASTGAGFRGTLRTGTDINALLAFPLTRVVATQGDRDARFFLGLSQKF